MSSIDENSETVINEWPESQECVGCTHAIFIPEGHGSSAYACDIGCWACSDKCRENRKDTTDEEWEAKFAGLI